MEPRRERKVVSVLFADLVGFTARAEQLDPEDVEAILRPYHERLRYELERHGGTVEKFIGDAVMALFGAPVAHEDDPERAVRAALAIRDWIREDAELEARIAIATGEALVSLASRPELGEGMAAGDVVNTAARLQHAAPVNGVLVDETTERATRRAIRYGQAEPVSAKGKAEPVRVWEAVEARASIGMEVDQGGAALVGRRRELDLLADALERAKAERSPQLVTLVGVPGIGKSRLVYELSRLVDAEPELVYWRQGRSLPYGEAVAYSALAEMAKAQAGILETDPPEAAERKLAETVAALVPEGGDRVLESLRPLVGLGGDADGATGRSEHFASWRRFVEALAEERPTVLVFEDLHWADDDLLDFADHLVEWGSDVPLLVVCTARPELLERRPGWGGGKQNALTLSISPLSDEDTARLLASLLERSALPAEVQAALLVRAGGNPLYAEQFARLLAESGSGSELALPENVQGIIAARLDGLPAEEKLLLQAAAVVGKVFWLGAVAAVAAVGRQEAEGWLHALARKEFVRRERRTAVAGEEAYAFRHVLVRDVAYGQIPRADRAGTHVRAAEWIERLGRAEDHAAMLAHHYLEALSLSRAARGSVQADLRDRARLAARDAGDRALALSAFPTAARFYEAALELWPHADGARPELLLAYGRSRADDGTLDESVLEEATEGLLREDKVEAAAEAQALLAGIALNRGDPSGALTRLEAALPLVEARPASREKAFVLQELGRMLMMGNRLHRALEVASESLRLADELGLDAARSRNLNTRGVVKVVQGDQAGGIADLEQSVAIAAAANSSEEIQASGNLTWMTAVGGDVRRAGELHERTMRAAERMGAAGMLRWHRAERAFHCHWEGRWDEALAIADEFIAESEAGQSHYMEAACRMVRSKILLARGDLPRATEDARRSAELAREIADPQTLNPSLAWAARARLAAGDRAGAGALADELLELWQASGIMEPHECADAPWLFVDLDRVADLDEALRAATARTRWLDAARLVIGGDLVGAAEVYSEIGSVPDEAHARLRAAEELASRGERAEADHQLSLARPLIAGLGATAWRAKADALLPASA